MLWKLNFTVTLYVGVRDLKPTRKLNVLLTRDPREIKNQNDLFLNKLKQKNNRVQLNVPTASFFEFLCTSPGPAR